MLMSVESGRLTMSRGRAKPRRVSRHCCAPAHRTPRGARRRGFTLIEILVAMAVTLMMMGMAVTIFATVSTAITGSKSTIEMTDRIRSTQTVLLGDFNGITVPAVPRRNPANDLGYLEIIEGPVGPVLRPRTLQVQAELPIDARLDTNGDQLADYDTTVGDYDDVLMFTTRTQGEPFVGNFAILDDDRNTGGPPYGITTGGTIQSHVAEVAWFLRGTTLYRRVLLVLPNHPDGNTATGPNINDLPAVSGFYGLYDLSVRQVGGPYSQDVSPGPARLVANSLGDLTKRENRFGHQPWVFPYDARFWGRLGLPTLRESTLILDTGMPGQYTDTGTWPFPLQTSDGDPPFDTNPPFDSTLGNNSAYIIPYGAQRDPYLETVQTSRTSGPLTQLREQVELYAATQPPAGAASNFDAWQNPLPWLETNQVNGTLAAHNPDPNAPEANIRIDEDVVLTNVLSFDVKVWDPGAPVFALVVDANMDGEPEEVKQVIAPGDPSYIGEYLVRWRDGELDPNGPLPVATDGLPDDLMGRNQDRVIYRYGAYVDLNYMCLLGPEIPGDINRSPPAYPNSATAIALPASAPSPQFHGAGNFDSRLRGTNPYTKDFSSPLTIATDWLPPMNAGSPPEAEPMWAASVYDTGSTHYENDGLDQDLDGVFDQATNGLDDNGVGGPDDVTELEVPPPYPAELRSIQVKIRTFEPDSRQIREVTIVHEFLSE